MAQEQQEKLAVQKEEVKEQIKAAEEAAPPPETPKPSKNAQRNTLPNIKGRQYGSTQLDLESTWKTTTAKYKMLYIKLKKNQTYQNKVS